MGDVPLRVGSGRAELVDADRECRGETRQAESAAANHSGVGERVELDGGLLDRPSELLGATVRVADRAVDPDAVDARADLGSELAVDDGGFFERLVLVGSDDAVASFLVEHGCAQPLPSAALFGLLAGTAADGDVHGECGGQRAAQQM